MSPSSCLLLAAIASAAALQVTAGPVLATDCVNKTLSSWSYKRYSEDVGAPVVSLTVNVEHYDHALLCIKDSGFGFIGSEVWVDKGCRAQFTLCTDNIDDCATAPCQHGATCTDLVNDYMCACTPGYTGRDCSTDIDDCATAPCQHGATCTDLVNDYTCACAPGYTGRNCSTVQGQPECVDTLPEAICNRMAESCNSSIPAMRTNTRVTCPKTCNSCAEIQALGCVNHIADEKCEKNREHCDRDVNILSAGWRALCPVTCNSCDE